MAPNLILSLAGAALMLLTGAALVLIPMRRRGTAAMDVRPHLSWVGTSSSYDRAVLELRAAIANGRIVPYFEPQIDLETGRIAGFGVYGYWPDRVPALPATDNVSDLAERTGLTGDLCLSLMRQAFAAAHDWNAGLTLSFGIAPQQLRDPWLAQKIIKALVETGFPASRLEIELDDATMGDDLPLAPSIAASLRNQGVRVALIGLDVRRTAARDLKFDRLKFDRLKFDRLKFDRVSMTLDMLSDPAAMARLVSLAESANLPVVARGVASPETAERLRLAGCVRAQGNHFGAPAGAAQTRRMLAEKRLLGHAPDRARTPFSLHLQTG